MVVSGCEEDRHSGAAGKLKFHITATGAVTDVTTRSGEEDVPEIGDFSMAMLQDGKVQASWDKLSDYDEDTTFPVGSYTLRAYYGDMEQEGFASPYYEGTADVIISGGATANVEATCKLANTKITIEYTDDFKTYFKTYSSFVQSDAGGEITFKSDELRAAYIKPGNVTVKVSFTKATGGSTTEPVVVTTIEDALPQHHYHLLMDVDAGKAMLSVVFDRVTEEKPITLDISDKALNIKAPYFTLTGFEKTSNDKNQWDGNLTEADKLSALLTSLGGFRSCVLKVNSPNITDWPDAGIDLADLNADHQALLDKYNFELTGFGANKDQMAIIDFTGIVPHLNISDANSTHLFSLQAISTYGKQSEEYVLNITTPKNFMLLPADPVKMGSTTVKLPVKLKEGNPDNVELYYKNYGTWTRINPNNVTNKAVAGKLGYYDFTANGISMGFVAKEFIARYNGIESSAIRVAVTVPKYRVILEDVDMFAKKAMLTIETEDDEDRENVIRSMDVQFFKNGIWTTVPGVVKSSSTVTVTGLEPNTTYQLRTSCDEGNTFVNGITGRTEDLINLENSELSSWTDGVSYLNISKGGKTSYWDNGLWGFGAKAKWNNAPTVTVSYQEPVGWFTSNSETVPANANPKNTWYMVPSVFQDENYAVLRSVAWNDGGSPVPDNTAATKEGGGNIPQPPTKFKYSAGKMFLGATFEEGTSFTSRPSGIRVTYKYVPVKNCDNDGGTVDIKIKNGGVVIGSGQKDLSSTSWETEDISITYTNMRVKATSMHLMLTSSIKYRLGKESEIVTANNTSDMQSVGSEIYIDKVELIYD